MAETLKEQLATARTRMHPDGRPVDFWLERSKEVHSVNGDEKHWLVGALEPWNFMTFPSYWEWNVIIPTDFKWIIFQRGSYTNHQPEYIIYRYYNHYYWWLSHYKTTNLSLNDDNFPHFFLSVEEVHHLTRAAQRGDCRRGRVLFGHGDFPEDGPPLITR